MHARCNVHRLGKANSHSGMHGTVSRHPQRQPRYGKRTWKGLAPLVLRAAGLNSHSSSVESVHSYGSLHVTWTTEAYYVSSHWMSSSSSASQRLFSILSDIQ